MDAETGFTINDQVYEVPAIDSFNMDEAQVLYDYSGLVIEDFTDAEDEAVAERFRNPGLIRALMHIAYQRKFPAMSPAKVRSLIGKANMIMALSSLPTEQQEDDARPPELTKPHSEQSNNDLDASKQPSGKSSPTDSEAPDNQQGNTGTGESDTSFQGSIPLTLAN